MAMSRISERTTSFHLAARIPSNRTGGWTPLCDRRSAGPLGSAGLRFGRDIVSLEDARRPRAELLNGRVPQWHSTLMCDESDANASTCRKPRAKRSDPHTCVAGPLRGIGPSRLNRGTHLRPRAGANLRSINIIPITYTRAY